MDLFQLLPIKTILAVPGVILCQVDSYEPLLVVAGVGLCGFDNQSSSLLTLFYLRSSLVCIFLQECSIDIHEHVVKIHAKSKA